MQTKQNLQGNEATLRIRLFITVAFSVRAEARLYPKTGHEPCLRHHDLPIS